MSRVVVDANVCLSALIRPQGPPGQILKRLLGERAHTIIVSKAILEEVRRSLDYPKVRKKLDATDEELDAWVDSIGVLADVPGVTESGWADRHLENSRSPFKSALVVEFCAVQSLDSSGRGILAPDDSSHESKLAFISAAFSGSAVDKSCSSLKSFTTSKSSTESLS